jgi:hypothetical protein
VLDPPAIYLWNISLLFALGYLILLRSVIYKVFSEKSIVTATGHQVSGRLQDGDVAILNLRDGVYYGLNVIGGRIWDLIQEPRMVAEVRDILLEEYHVERERCTQEVIALLEDLLKRGLIEIRNEPAV